MKSSNWTRLIVTALIGCAVAAPAAPALGQGDDQIVIRDGSDAVPFVADVSKASGASSRDPVVRRDGSAAVPFVADLDPEAPAAADGFDWGAAGAAAGLGIATLLLVLAARALHGRRRRSLRAPRPGSPTASG